MVYHVYIGVDSRESIAAQVCRYSIERFNNPYVKVHFLETRPLRQQGLFTRSYTVEPEGEMIDKGDGRPFSTDFAFTRFLVPELHRQLPGPAEDLIMFVDCDFVFLEDPERLFEQVQAQRRQSNCVSPVYVVHHNYKPTEEKKMDGVSQSIYNCKLWSALMIFDMAHEDNDKLTPDVVNTALGKELHSFHWVTEKFRIGRIDEQWHFVPNHSEKNIPGPPKAIHYTAGGPWFPNMKNCRYADVWLGMYQDYLNSTTTKITFNTDKLLF